MRIVSQFFSIAVLSLSAATAQASLPPEVNAAVPDAKLSAAGTGKLTFFGLDVYESSLWVSNSFKAPSFDKHFFALELHYLRNFTAQAIAQRSLEEMNRLEPLPEQVREQWQTTLQAALPNIKKGDRLIGLHQPGVGVTFWSNGKRSGEIRDAAFSRQFFAIWLSNKTSEPKLRRAMLAKLDESK